MSSIINAIFGHHKDKDDKKQHETVDTATTASASTSSGSSVAHTAISDDVRVQSVVSTETNSSVRMQNSKKISDLMNKLGTTHTQIDEYSKKRTAEINDAVSNAIDKVVSDTAAQQQQLLSDANQRSSAIDHEYNHHLQTRLAELDAEKAILLAELERTLNARQEAILLKARQDIDLVQNAGNQEKMAVFKEAQSRSSHQVDQITEQVAELAAEDAQRRLQSTTQTVITTKAVASGETHMPATHIHSGSATTTTTSRSSESHHASSNH